MVLLLIIWILHPINKAYVQNNNKNFPFLY